jgi:integrase
MRRAGYFVHRCMFATGERFPVLMGREGFPVSLPARFIVDRVRDRRQANTIEAKVRAIGFLYQWAASIETPLDMESRLRSARSLTRTEVTSFCRFLRACRVHDVIPFEWKSVRPAERTGVLGNNTFNIYLANVREFVMWAAETQSSPPLGPIETRKLERLFDSEKLTATPPRKLYGLDAGQQKELLRIVHPDADDNPFNMPVRQRNHLIVRILLETGIRRGELCKLRVEDVQTKGGADAFIEVVRRPDDRWDPRQNEPAVKTRGRRIPISSELKSLMLSYLQRLRGRVKHPYLFTDPSTGMPISSQVENKIIAQIRKRCPTLEVAKLTPHVLRRTFNGNLWERSKVLGWDEGKIKRITNYLNGWTETSQQSAIYQRKQIEQDAFELLGVIQAQASVKRSP